METIIIFCAKYFYIASLLLVAVHFIRVDADSRKRLAKTALLLLPLSYVLGLIARALYYNPRPFVLTGAEPLITHAADNGFPSDHTLLAASLASLMMFFNRRISITLWVIALAVAWGRVAAGVHHWLDVAGSITISLIAASMIYLSGKFKNNYESYR